jgi:hypothetical protein
VLGDGVGQEYLRRNAPEGDGAAARGVRAVQSVRARGEVSGRGALQGGNTFRLCGDLPL